MGNIYSSLADIAKAASAKLLGSLRRIPVIKYDSKSFIFFFIDSTAQADININTQLYDFFTRHGIFPSLIGGYFIVDRLDELIQSVDCELKAVSLMKTDL